MNLDSGFYFFAARIAHVGSTYIDMHGEAAELSQGGGVFVCVCVAIASGGAGGGELARECSFCDVRVECGWRSCGVRGRGRDNGK